MILKGGWVAVCDEAGRSVFGSAARATGWRLVGLANLICWSCERGYQNWLPSMSIDGELLQRIRQIWDAARSHAARSVNSAHVAANWLIGQQIVEAEQGGAERAAYGTRLLESLSSELTGEYSSGFSVSSQRYMRLFYLGYPEPVRIQHAVRDIFDLIVNARRSLFAGAAAASSSSLPKRLRLSPPTPSSRLAPRLSVGLGRDD